MAAKSKKGNNMKKYPEELKRNVVAEYATWEGSRGEFLAKYAIPNTTLHQWLHAYAKPLPAEEKRQAVRATHIDKLEAQLEKALTVVKILKASNLFTRATRREKLDEMKRLSDQYSVRSLSDAFNIARGTYYNDTLRAKGEDAWYRVRRRELMPEVQRIFEESHGAYGADMIALKLKQEGNGADPATVRSIMEELNIESNRNTASRKYQRMRRQLANRLRKHESEFTASAPNRLWVCDVTELHYHRTRVYLCVIVDIFARKVVGFQFGVRNCTRLVVRTFLSAYESRKPDDGLVFHSDRGSANLSRRFMDCLKTHNVIQSASRPHTPQDNAVIESFFRNLKAEIINPCQYRSQREMVDAVKHWLETYNAKRPHSYNRGKTPNDAENEFFMHSKDIQA